MAIEVTINGRPLQSFDGTSSGAGSFRTVPPSGPPPTAVERAAEAWGTVRVHDITADFGRGWFLPYPGQAGPP